MKLKEKGDGMGQKNKDWNAESIPKDLLRYEKRLKELLFTGKFTIYPNDPDYQQYVDVCDIPMEDKK